MSKILLIEDDISFCKMLENFLVKKSYSVETAFTVEDAKTKIKNQNFDLIITDLRLPDYDGIQLMTEFKREYPTTPVILMTGYSDVNTAVKAIKNGAADYISKPFNPEEVLLVIANTLKTPAVSAINNTTVPDVKKKKLFLEFPMHQKNWQNTFN
jgi:two-component system, NtrC family, response regulator HydG